MWGWVYELFDPAPSQVPAVNYFRDDFLAALNNARKSRGLQPFVWSFVLQRESETNNDHQRRRDATGHYTRRYVQCAGSGYTNSAQAVNGWLSNPMQCDILMNPRYTQAGAAVSYPWWTVSLY